MTQENNVIYGMEIMKNDIISNACEINFLKEKINAMNTISGHREQTREVEGNDSLQIEKIDQLLQRFLQMETKIENINRKLTNQITRGSIIVISSVLIISIIVSMNGRLNLPNSWSKNISNEEGIKHDEQNKQVIKSITEDDSQPKFGEIEWRIDSFSANKRMAERKVVTVIYSNPFYTHENGYKLALAVHPNGDKLANGLFLSIGFSIMRGPFDHLLTWPMKHRVILELINQQTGLVHLSYTVKNDLSPNSVQLQRPSSDKNGSFGFGEYISLEELLHNEELTKNDQLIIRSRIILIN